MYLEMEALAFLKKKGQILLMCSTYNLKKLEKKPTDDVIVSMFAVSTAFLTDISM